MAWLEENADVREISWNEADKLQAAIASAEGLLVRTYTQVTDELLAFGSKVEAVVGRGGGGVG